MKKYTSLLAVLLASTPVHAATPITETFTMATTASIPDGDLSGLLQTITPTTTIGSVELVTLTLNTTGGWAGDLYAYLWHDNKLAVLVNRPGRTGASPDGSASPSMTLVLEDAAAMDVHMAPGTIAGTFQPDGRVEAPSTALDTSPRSQPLANFLGSPASGDWRLFIADVSTGDVATLSSWSVSITGQVIPEASTAGLLLLGLLGANLRRQRL